MELSISLSEYLSRLTILHPTLCPRQVLGVQMARFACCILNIDPAIERKSMFVYMEIGRCAADAVMIVTGASPMNRLMQLVDYGKVAATFVNFKTNQSVHISERHDSRSNAISVMPAHLDAWQAQRDAYQVLSYDQLFNAQWVRLCEPIPQIGEKYSLTCDRCGDRIHDHHEVILSGRTLCKSCAYGAYYTTVVSIC